ncbi:SDR family NAD(P)-dependent oxidoreductase [Paenalcaligenes hominis]|uniref:SDR family NAD(P)-dependent oxidoreductase n=1 Tax=Paenalcaligenes hominis TaxID=643674 RepID=UPI003523C8B9
MLSFIDKRVLVTGAGRGMGAVIAHGFAARGAHVIVADIDQDNAQKVATEIAQLGFKASAHRLDVADSVDVKNFARTLRQTQGPMHIVINNAGISGRESAEHETEEMVWDRVIATNLSGTRNVAYAFKEDLIATQGNLVNFSSIVAFVSGSSRASYIASKGAVRSLTQALARDLGKYGVRVNAVAPGFILTDMVQPQLATESGTDWYMHRAPLKRGGQPEEMVGPVLFLASELASYVSGVILPVDGGFLAA